MPKSKNEKKKAAAAAGKAPKLTKQQENAGKSAKQKKADKQVRDRWCFFFPNFLPPPFRKLNKNIIARSIIVLVSSILTGIALLRT